MCCPRDDDHLFRGDYIYQVYPAVSALVGVRQNNSFFRSTSSSIFLEACSYCSLDFLSNSSEAFRISFRTSFPLLGAYSMPNTVPITPPMMNPLTLSFAAIVFLLSGYSVHFLDISY